MLGPPGCDDCNVWLKLDDRPKGRGWYCPVCDGDGGTNYKWLYEQREMHDESSIPLLRFLKGKKPQDQK